MFLLSIKRWNLHVITVLLCFVWCIAIFSEVYSYKGYRKTDCIRVNCNVYGKTTRIEEEVTFSLFPRIANVWRHISSRFFFVREFINVYTLWFIFRWHRWRWRALWRTLILFRQDILNISLFPSMTMDLVNLVTQGTVIFSLDRFLAYIFDIYSFTRSMP